MWSPTWEIICTDYGREVLDGASLCKMGRNEKATLAMELFVVERRATANCYRNISHIWVGGQSWFHSVQQVGLAVTRQCKEGKEKETMNLGISRTSKHRHRHNLPISSIDRSIHKVKCPQLNPSITSHFVSIHPTHHQPSLHTISPILSLPLFPVPVAVPEFDMRKLCSRPA